jgi:hypothetical protein
MHDSVHGDVPCCTISFMGTSLVARFRSWGRPLMHDSVHGDTLINNMSKVINLHKY